MEKNKSILVTGAAGFIGFHLAARLLADGFMVVGFDNLNDYYDPSIKRSRLDALSQYNKFTFIRGDLANQKDIQSLFSLHPYSCVIHLAAQAGVRYSLTNPQAYVDSNLTGFLSVLEACRALNTDHLLFASSSSVYGANQKLPYTETDTTDHPISLYAASKKANEMMAHSYAHLFSLPVTGLRFFTVYGPWGRPDMALFKFTKALFEGKELDVFNGGDMYRGFTYIDDVVESIIRLIPQAPVSDLQLSMTNPRSDRSSAPFKIYNIGSATSVYLKEMIKILELQTGCKAKINSLPMQAGDVPKTASDTSSLQAATGYVPQIGLEEGIQRFVEWYKGYYKI